MAQAALPSIADTTGGPVVRELDPVPAPSDAFLALAQFPHCVFFDSALRDPQLGRFSYLAADPFHFSIASADDVDALGDLDQALKRYRTNGHEELPPFQGGAAGLFSYDLGRTLETIPLPHRDEFGVPAMAVGFYDVVVVWDHLQDRAWIVSQGFPEIDPQAQMEHARDRLEWMQCALGRTRTVSEFETLGCKDAIPVDELSPQYEAPGPAGLGSNFSARGYRDAVGRAIEWIWAGDVFQVNLSQRLLFPAQGSAVGLYLRLRERNPAPFAAYFDAGDFQICSTSPERFLQLYGRDVEARPIKGTRARASRPEADLFSALELRQSQKDRAENVMIVDLLRNDLSRVCLADSVKVAQLCAVENYAYVQHLVSAVRGRLKDGCSPVDLLKATFPGGSITGAPKIRAMEIIAELEPNARGAYCGSLGYIGFDGVLDSSILIRTITAGKGWWQIPVGGGIVAQSDPLSEYEETWHKAEGMLRALG